MAKFVNNASAIGDFGDDWSYTGSSKVASVQVGGDDYIYLDSPNKNLQIRFHLPSGMPTTVFSEDVELTTTPTEYEAELGVGWSMGQYNQGQIAVAGGTDFMTPQSFRCFTQPTPLHPNPFVTTAIGGRLEAWYEDLGEGVFRLKVKPLLRYCTY